MSDFEQDFMTQVQGNEQAAPASGLGGEKKKIDKRWFVLGGVAVVLIGVMVVLNIITGSRGDVQGGGGLSAEAKNLVGMWQCGDELAMTFYGDGSYIWARGDGENGLALEAGKFVASSSRLTIHVGSVTTSAGYESIEETVVHSMELGEASLALIAENGGGRLNCERVNNE